MKIDDILRKDSIIADLVGTNKAEVLRDVTDFLQSTGLIANKDSILNHLDPKKYTFLPNTAGCYTLKEAVMTCELAREAGLGNIVKVEVIGDEKNLFPDNEATLEASKLIINDGLHVLP